MVSKGKEKSESMLDGKKDLEEVTEPNVSVEGNDNTTLSPVPVDKNKHPVPLMPETVPVVGDHEFLAMTVWMEAQGESWKGKCAVAFTIANRMRKGNGYSASDVVLKKLQFSCWNSDSPVRMNLDSISPDDQPWIDSWKAAELALSKDEMYNPIGTYDLYMNVPLVEKTWGIPDWWNRASKNGVDIVVGNHTFRKDN